MVSKVYSPFTGRFSYDLFRFDQIDHQRRLGDRLADGVHSASSCRGIRSDRHQHQSEPLRINASTSSLAHVSDSRMSPAHEDRFLHTSLIFQGSSSAEEHGCYVWEHFVRPSAAKHVCIMAHSYGGAVVLAMVCNDSLRVPDRDIVLIGRLTSFSRNSISACSPSHSQTRR